MNDGQLLSKFEYGLKTILKDNMMGGVGVDHFVERVVELQARSIMTTLRVPGQLMYERSFPKDWRWAVYERFAPQWMKSRWVVQTVTVSVRALMPNLILPDERVSWKVETR